LLVGYLLTSGTGAGADDHGDTPQAGTRLELTNGIGGGATGKINYAGDVDYFVITSTVNGRLDLNVAALTSGLNSAVDVYNSRGQVVATNDNASTATKNSRVVFHVQADQTYSIRIRAVGTKRGDYSLTVDGLLGTF